MSTKNFSERRLHLVSFDIPIPVNYGGVIDIYHKLLAFKEENIKVILHCYQYDREPSPLLADLCEQVHYYPRDRSIRHLLSARPFIVCTRQEPDLLKRLLADDDPILFEGIHTCAFLDAPELQKKRRIVRTHNIEHDYYRSLARVERRLLKKLYFYREARQLRRYEYILSKADGIAAISKKDTEHFLAAFPETPAETISAFHPFSSVDITPGRGEYALYHGSLEVGENNEAALFLIREVFPQLPIPLVIAGNRPSRDLLKAVAAYPNVSLQSDLSTEDIYRLVRNAHINILPTFQATGIKLKLLAALYIGRHCVVNPPMVEQTGLESLCHIAINAKEMRETVKMLLDRTLSEEEIALRKSVLEQGDFSNSLNIKKLARLIFGQ